MRSLINFHRWTRRHFYVMDGPPIAYFELNDDKTGHQFRVVYVTLRYRTKGRGALTRLITSLKTDLGIALRLKDTGFGEAPIKAEGELVRYDAWQKPLLFWRKRPYFERRGGYTYMRCRVAIPSASLPVVPEGGVSWDV